MPTKECFQVGTKHLKFSNYALSLNEDCYIAAYQERVILGRVEDFDQDMAKFNKKAIVIPSNVYFEFVNCISKAYQHFQDGKEEPFEEVIYRHSKVHWIVGKYEMDEDSEEMNLKIIIKWNFAKDR